MDGRVFFLGDGMTTGRALLVDHCGQLLTLRGPRRPRVGKEMGQLGLLRNAALLVQEGHITCVGPQLQITGLPEAQGADRIDAGGRVVMPGFVDSHTHALFAGSRVDEYEARIRGATYAGLAKSGGGIQASARRMRGAKEAVLLDHLRRVSARFLEFGTTTVEVKSGYGLEADQELKMLRVIKQAMAQGTLDLVPTLLFHDVPGPWRKKRAAFLAMMIEQVIPLVAREGLAEFCDAFCDRGYFSLSEARQLLTAAKTAGLKLRLHAEQLAHTGSARMAAGLGALSVDHLDHVTRGDVGHLRKAGTIATLLPGSVLYLDSSPYPPARMLMEAGVPVALATNFNPGSCPTQNMQLILSLACTHMRMTPAETLTAATINGAYAVARGHLVGSLEAGKQADILVMDVADYREIPYYFGMNHCVTVIKKGRIAYDRTRLSRAASSAKDAMTQ